MSSNDDFLGGLKSKEDQIKEWTDSAQFYVDIRRDNKPQDVVAEPVVEYEKKAEDTTSLQPAQAHIATTKGNYGRLGSLLGMLGGGGTGLAAGTGLSQLVRKKYPALEGLAALAPVGAGIGIGGLVGHSLGKKVPWERKQLVFGPEPTKTASIGKTVFEGIKRYEPTGLAKAMSTKPGLIAGLAGGALFGLGVGLGARGKKELGGQSPLEHSMAQDKAMRDASPEPKGFAGKLLNNFKDLSAGLASTARKHPVKAGLVGSIGGAKAGTQLLKLFRKG